MLNQPYLTVFRERWIAIAAGLLLGVLAAVAIIALTPARYSSTTTLVVTVQSKEGSLIERSQYAVSRVASYPQLGTSSSVLSRTIDDLSLDVSVEQLRGDISIANPPTTALVTVTAEAADAQLAADIADTVGKHLATAVSALENSPQDRRYIVSLSAEGPAVAPASASSPQKVVILALGIIAGLALGLIGAIVWSRLDTRIRGARDVRRVTGLPVLGALPHPHTHASGGVADAAAYADANQSIRHANGNARPSLLLLVPADGDTGDAHVRVGLARDLASQGRRVCLVETDHAAADALAAAIPTLDGTAETGGLSELLGSGRLLKRLTPAVDGEEFALLRAGNADNPGEERAEKNARQAVKQLTDAFGTVIAQATPVSRPASLELLAPYADGVILTAQHGHTSSAQLARAAARVRLLGIRPLGVLLSDVPARRSGDLFAEWQPGDFSEEPRMPLRPLEDAPAE